MKLKAHNICLSILFCIPLFSFAKEKEVTANRHYEERFDISQGDQLEIDGSFASFTIENWDKNEISISGDVNIEAKNQDKAERIADNVHVKMTKTASGVLLEVELKNNNNSWNGKGSTEMNIDFVVKAPSWIGLDADVSFGELTIDRIDPSVHIDLEYGSLDASSLRGTDNDISISFGSAKMDACGGGDIDNSYGELVINSLNGSMELDNSYGESSIHESTHRASKIEVDNSFGEVTLHVSSDVTYAVETSSSFGDVDISGSWSKSSSDSDWESENKKGTLKGGSESGSISIDSSFGSVNLKQD